MTGAESIRDVIAFPKTQRAQCLLTQRAEPGRREAAARAAHPAAQPAGRRRPDAAAGPPASAACTAVGRVAASRRMRLDATSPCAPPRSPSRCWWSSTRRHCEVLLIERADQPGFWQSVTGSQDAPDEPLARDRAARGGRGNRHRSARRAAHAARLGAAQRLRDLPGLAPPLCAGRHAQHRACVRPDGAARHAGAAGPARAPAATRWLPWREAADRCFSPSNAEAILQLPRFAGAAAMNRTQSLAFHAAAAAAGPRQRAARGHLQHPQGRARRRPAQAAGDPQPGPGRSRRSTPTWCSCRRCGCSTRARRGASSAPRSAGPTQGQADFLAPEGYEVAYRTNAVTRHGEHGNALLSRWPIGDVGHHDVSDHRFEQRGLLHVPVHWNGVTGARGGGALRAGARAAACARCSGWPTSSTREVPAGEMLVVAGDFNDWGEKLDAPMRALRPAARRARRGGRSAQR